MARPRSDIQPRIVEAARARFLAAGVDGASLREIARDAETNIGMIVYYFATKDDLFLAVVEEVYAGIVADMAAILENDGRSVRERLRGAFVRLGHASDREIEVIQLVIRESISSSARLHRVLARFMRGHVGLLMATIAEGVKTGEIDRSIPVPLGLLAVVGLGGVPQIARRAGKAIPIFAALPSVERLADICNDLLFCAIGTEDTRTIEPRGRGRVRASRS